MRIYSIRRMFYVKRGMQAVLVGGRLTIIAPRNGQSFRGARSVRSEHIRSSKPELTNAFSIPPAPASGLPVVGARGAG